MLAPGCPEGVENLYLRDSATGTLTCLTPEVPQAASFSCFNYAGSSEDGTRVFFASGASYAGAPKGNGFNLYEWSAGGGLKPISILPGQSAAGGADPRDHLRAQSRPGPSKRHQQLPVRPDDDAPRRLRRRH